MGSGICDSAHRIGMVLLLLSWGLLSISTAWLHFALECWGCFLMSSRFFLLFLADTLSSARTTFAATASGVCFSSFSDMAIPSIRVVTLTAPAVKQER